MDWVKIRDYFPGLTERRLQMYYFTAKMNREKSHPVCPIPALRGRPRKMKLAGVSEKETVQEATLSEKGMGQDEEIFLETGEKYSVSAP
jgi:hypothetical protein